MNNEQRQQFAVIVHETARHFGVTPAQIRGELRYRNIVRARFVAMFMARRIMRLTQYQIGELLARDHSTVLHGIAKIGREIDSDNAKTISDVSQLTRALSERKKIPPRAAEISKELASVSAKLIDAATAIETLRAKFLAACGEPTEWPNLFEPGKNDESCKDDRNDNRATLGDIGKNRIGKDVHGESHR